MREDAAASDDDEADSSFVGPPVPTGFDPSSVVPGPSSGAVQRHQVAAESDSDEEQVEGGEGNEVRSMFYGWVSGRCIVCGGTIMCSSIGCRLYIVGNKVHLGISNVQ